MPDPVPSAFDPEHVVGWTLVRAYKAMAERFRATFAEVGLSEHEFGILVRLRENPSTSQAALAREVFVTPQSAGVIIRGLMESGLIARDPVRPGRAARLELTPAGRQRLRESAALVERLNRPENLGLDAEESATLNRLLHRVRTRLEGGDEDP